MPDKKSYYGFIPNDQNGYVDRLRRVIQQSKIMQYGQNPGPQNVQQQQPGPRPQIMMGMNPIAQQNNAMNPQNNPQIGNMQQQQGDQGMMFNQQMQMQAGPMVPNQPMNPNQQRMARPMMQNNNLRHLLQQVRTKFDLNFYYLKLFFHYVATTKSVQTTDGRSATTAAAATAESNAWNGPELRSLLTRIIKV